MKTRFLILLSVLASILVGGVAACTYAPDVPAPHLGSLIVPTFAGDLDGSMVSQRVVGIEGNPLAPPPAGEGGVAIEWDGAALYWGTAGGSIAPGSAGQVLATNDAGAATTWVYPHGDVDASATDPGAITVNAIQGYGVSTSVPTTGNQLRWSGSLWGPAALNLGGGSGYVTGVLPTGNQASQSLGGELSGTTAAAVVAGPFSTANLAWGASVTSPTLTQGTATSDVAPQNLTFTPQAPYASAVTHVNSGDLVVDNTELGSGNKNGGLLVAMNGNPMVRLGAYNGGATWGAVWFEDGGTATTTNFSFLGSNTDTFFNAPSSSGNLYFGIGTNYLLNATSTQFSIGSTLASANGVVFGFTTTTTPQMLSGTNSTLLTVGTDKTGAVMQLVGDAVANVAKLTTAFEHQTYADFDAVATPGTPLSTQRRVYVDASDRLVCEDNLGNITVLAP